MLSRIVRAAVLCVAVGCALAPPAAAKDLGKVGRTYPIAESDMLREIERRAAAVDWSKHFDPKNMKEKVANYRPAEGLVALPRATRESIRTVSIAHTLEFDITDSAGNVIYPKGFVFNPLDYVRYPKTIVVLNGEDRLQVEWFKQSRYAKDVQTMLIITGGSYYALGEALARPVFYINELIAKKFSLRSVPSVIRQSGTMMEIREVDIEAARTNNRS